MSLIHSIVGMLVVAVIQPTAQTRRRVSCSLGYLCQLLRPCRCCCCSCGYCIRRCDSSLISKPYDDDDKCVSDASEDDDNEDEDDDDADDYDDEQDDGGDNGYGSD